MAVTVRVRPPTCPRPAVPVVFHTSLALDDVASPLALDEPGDAGDVAFVEFAVRDSGVGIAGDECPLLFNAFAISRTGTNQEAGSGLGLNICKQLVRGADHVMLWL